MKLIAVTAVIWVAAALAWWFLVGAELSKALDGA